MDRQNLSFASSPVFLFSLCPRVTYMDKSSISCDCVQVLCLPITSLTCNWSCAVFPLSEEYWCFPIQLILIFLLILIASAKLLKLCCSYSLYHKLLGERSHCDDKLWIPFYLKQWKKRNAIQILIWLLCCTKSKNEMRNYFKHRAF